MTAAVVALLAAVSFGWSTALMHHSASRAPQHATGLIRLLRHLVVQPRWLLGMATSLSGLALHAVALRLGSLALVQPLIVTALVFAFLFRAALDRQAPPRALVGWVLLTAAGLAMFLLAAANTTGSDQPSGTAAAVILGVGAVVAAACFQWSRRVVAARTGLLLGVSAGVVFGLIAGVLKTATGVVARGTPLLSAWPVYVLAALGVTGFLLNQRAYQRAPLASSLPVLNIVNPLVAVLFGVLVFHERPSENPAVILVEVLGLAAMLAGVSFLARVPEQAPQPADIGSGHSSSAGQLGRGRTSGVLEGAGQCPQREDGQSRDQR